MPGLPRWTSDRYTYGDCFGDAVNGRARAEAELAELARKYAEFTVFVVEVCPGCRWNHLLASYVLGRGRIVRRRRARTNA